LEHHFICAVPILLDEHDLVLRCDRHHIDPVRRLEHDHSVGTPGAWGDRGSPLRFEDVVVLVGVALSDLPLTNHRYSFGSPTGPPGSPVHGATGSVTT